MKNTSPNQFSSLIEPSLFKKNGESTIVKGKYGYKRETFQITLDTSPKFNRPQGKYTILTLSHILSPNKPELAYYQEKLSQAIKDYIPALNKSDTVLIVGLGNRHISSDSLGTEVVKNIHITPAKNTPKVCVFAPSVLGLTGIETADTISGITTQIKPKLMIMIDSLCASNTDRLGTSFQISNTPITPGSGINNPRKKIAQNINTISIGVPLVVYGNTFIISALEKCGLTPNNIHHPDIKAKIKALYSQPNTTLVTLNEIDYIAKELGEIIAHAINKALNI